MHALFKEIVKGDCLISFCLHFILLESKTGKEFITPKYSTSVIRQKKKKSMCALKKLGMVKVGIIILF